MLLLVLGIPKNDCDGSLCCCSSWEIPRWLLRLRTGDAGAQARKPLRRAAAAKQQHGRWVVVFSCCCSSARAWRVRGNGPARTGVALLPWTRVLVENKEWGYCRRMLPLVGEDRRGLLWTMEYALEMMILRSFWLGAAQWKKCGEFFLEYENFWCKRFVWKKIPPHDARPRTI